MIDLQFQGYGDSLRFIKFIIILWVYVYVDQVFDKQCYSLPERVFKIIIEPNEAPLIGGIYNNSYVCVS